MVCGYGQCDAALDFHHIDPDEKNFGICRRIDKAWETIQKELDKCVLLCKNCHAEYHDGYLDLEPLLDDSPNPNEGLELLRKMGYSEDEI